MSSSAKHIPYLDGWRGVAILAVLFSHFVLYPKFWWLGRWGVQLFFVLSGYLMCQILFIRQIALKDFFCRRAIRIIPAFLFYVFVIVGMFALFTPEHYIPSPINLLGTLTFLRTYVPFGENIFKDPLPIVHFWSLNVEEHSYVFLAGIAAFTRNIRNRWLTVSILAAATAISFGFNCWHFIYPPMSGSPGDVRTEAASLAILASVTIAYTKHFFPSKMYARIPAILPIAAVLISVLFFPKYDGFLKLTLSPVLLAFAINFFDRVPQQVLNLLSLRALRWFGVCSFSIYLWQQPFLWLSGHNVSGSLMGVCGTICGAIMYYYFEQPVRLKLTRAWERRRQIRKIHADQQSLIADVENPRLSNSG